MKIAIIGKGNVGSALAGTFQAAGHEVVLGVRDPAGAAVEGLRVAGLVEAAAGAELVVLATPFAAVDAVLEALGDLSGVVLVDATNPLRWSEGPVHAPPAEGSAAAHIQALRPGARVVKAWSTMGAEHMAHPTVAGAPVTVLMAGDDLAAKSQVAALARSAGFAPADAGPLRNAAAMEQLAVLWIHLALVGGQGRGCALQLVHAG